MYLQFLFVQYVVEAVKARPTATCTMDMLLILCGDIPRRSLLQIVARTIHIVRILLLIMKSSANFFIRIHSLLTFEGFSSCPMA